MRDALILVIEIKQANTCGLGCLSCGCNKLGSTRHEGVVVSSRKGIDDVIHCAEHVRGIADDPVVVRQAGEGDAAGTFVHENAIDIENAGFIG